MQLFFCSKVWWVVQRPTFLPWHMSSGPKLKWSCQFFLLFAPSLIKIHPFRPHKQTENLKKITQLEGGGLQSLKIDDESSPNDRYMHFPPDRTLKSSRWFSSFLLHFWSKYLSQMKSRREEKWSIVNKQASKNRYNLLRPASDFCLQVDFRASVWLSFSRHLAIFCTNLAADLPCFKVLQISLDLTFLFVTQLTWKLFRSCVLSVNPICQNFNGQLDFGKDLIFLLAPFYNIFYAVSP